MRVIVDDKCEAHGLCVDESPELFRLDDDDTLHVLQDPTPDALREKAEKAVKYCPRNALRIEN